MLLNPAFPPDALERQRAQALVSLTLAKNRPETIGARVFPKVIYGAAHPFGQQTSEESIKAITRDDIVALHHSYYQPGRAIITVVGDVDAKSVKASIEKSLAAWSKGGEKPSFDYPKLPERKPTAIDLVDKPGAAQSIFLIGLPGPARSTPDYFPLVVLNRILGGHFQSRLNHNIREVHGYSYGVNSAFAYGHGPGPFRAGGAIVSDKTDVALIEFMREIRGVLGEKPITDEELKSAKEGLIQAEPRTFASVAGIGGAITDLLVNDLPDDYYQNYAKSVSAVTKEDLARVAKAHIDIDHLAIVIVGDRASIEAPLKATGIAPIVVLDIDGNPIGSTR
jgi:zinc protease